MANQFYIKNQDGELFGPFSQSEVKQEINQGSILLDDFISKSEQGPWVRVKEAITQVNQAKKSLARKEAEVSGTHLPAKNQIHAESIQPSPAESFANSDNDYPINHETAVDNQALAVERLFDPEGSSPKINLANANRQSVSAPSNKPEVAPVEHDDVESHLNQLETSPAAEPKVLPVSEQKKSYFKQSLNYLTFATSLLALLAIGGYYYTHDVLKINQPTFGDKQTETSNNENPTNVVVPEVIPVDLTASQANLLHDMIEKAFIGEKVVSVVNEISSMVDEKKVALYLEQMRHDLSRLKLWADKNNHALAGDAAVNEEIQHLLLTRELAITLAESLQFGGYIPWMIGNDKFSRQTNARAEKILIVKIYQPKVDDTMKNIPWAEKLLTKKPVEIPDPSQKGIFLYFNALDWAKYIDQQEEQILKRLKDLL
jgi:hypothetical protein